MKRLMITVPGQPHHTAPAFELLCNMYSASSRYSPICWWLSVRHTTRGHCPAAADTATTAADDAGARTDKTDAAHADDKFDE